MLALCFAIGSLIFNIIALAFVIKSNKITDRVIADMNDQLDYLHELGNKRWQSYVQFEKALKGKND